MEELRKLLDTECCYRMKDKTMDRFLGLMTEVELKRGEPLIDYGAFDNNVYVVKEGIMRVAWFSGFKENTYGFALPGTLLISYYPFYNGEPAFSKFEACCPSTVMKISKIKFLDLARESHDFSQWMMFMSLCQLLVHEKKREIVNGDAKERFEAFVEVRPQIVENVSSKILASYIGITPQYICRLKRQFVHKMKK
jgi:CRP-like cAMP-binding protein